LEKKKNVTGVPDAGERLTVIEERVECQKSKTEKSPPAGEKKKGDSNGSIEGRSSNQSKEQEQKGEKESRKTSLLDGKEKQKKIVPFQCLKGGEGEALRREEGRGENIFSVQGKGGRSRCRKRKRKGRNEKGKGFCRRTLIVKPGKERAAKCREKDVPLFLKALQNNEL